jgi:hypothetical protein
MTSKKKFNSPFRKTFAYGMAFFISVGVILLLFIIGAISSYFFDKPDASENQKLKIEGSIVPETENKKTPDIVYLEKVVFQKCTKKHCEEPIQNIPAPIEKENQHDTTKN